MKTCVAWKRKWLAAWIVLLPFAASAWSTPASPSLLQYHEGSDFVLVVHVLETRPSPGPTTICAKLAIDEVIKAPPDSFKDKKTLEHTSSITRYQVGERYLVFGVGGAEYVYVSVKLEAGSGVEDYFRGAVKLTKKTERYRYLFEFLEHKDSKVADDAFAEFTQAGTKEIAAIAKTLPADKIAAWVADRATLPERRQFYAYLLGHCGRAEHARLLRSKIAESARCADADVTGCLKGYVLLQPKQGWEYLQLLLADPNQPYSLRCCAVETAEYIQTEHAGLVDSRRMVLTVAPVLGQTEVPVQAVEVLRRAKAWELTEQVLSLYGRRERRNLDKGRNVLMFALQSPEPCAASFVEDLRKTDPSSVLHAEECLRIADAAW